MLHSFYSTFILLKLLQFNMVLCLIKIHIHQKKTIRHFFNMGFMFNKNPVGVLYR